MGDSLLLRSLEELGVERVLSIIEKGELALEWRALARPEQLAPGSPGSFSDRAWWRFWLALAGRRFGKTRTGAEWVQEEVAAGRRMSWGLIAPTLNDAWKIMVEDPTSGLLAIAPGDMRPRMLRSHRLLLWPNGAKAEIHTSEEPDRLRGRFFDGLWGEELGFWVKAQETMDMANFALSRSGPKGDPPRAFFATTPKPIPLLRDLVKRARKQGENVVMSTGSLFDNAANLDPDAVNEFRNRYEGTRLGMQELYAILLDDVEGALWKHDLIDKARWREQAIPPLIRAVVGVDPSGSAKKTADEAGIIVAGVGECRCKGKPERHVFVLEDCTGRYDPPMMGKCAIAAYHKWECGRLVAEDNFGGETIRAIIKLLDDTVAYRAVHASRGKIIRAEPVAALYEQGRVHHVGMFVDLEGEMCSYAPLTSTESPGRLDALVWAITDLVLGEQPVGYNTTSEWRGPRRSF